MNAFRNLNIDVEMISNSNRIVNLLCEFFIPICTNSNVNSNTKLSSGELDHIPEVAFYMVGDIDEVMSKAESL
jgi:hypothetical protein